MATPYSRARRGSVPRASSKSHLMDCSPTGQARPSLHLQPHYPQQHRPPTDSAAHQQLYQHHHISDGSRQRAASVQALQPVNSVMKDSCPSSSSTLLQRRSCGLPTLGLAAAAPSSMMAASTTTSAASSTATASASVAPYQHPLTASTMELPVQGQTSGLQPSANSWQDWMGSSGALPVRQALHSFIASSCEKPPETKEEARAALEVMFQLRAEKIRRAIEQGKLATTEALKHKVIHRRKSLAIGEARRNSANASCSTPGFMGPSIGNKSPTGFSQEPYSRDQHGAEALRSMSVDRPSTFGLSDDDLMTSFTSFTDRFSDSLLSRSGAAESHGGDGGSLQSPDQRLDWVNAASLSPPSLEKSPVTPDALLSRPAWTPMSYPTSAQQLSMVAPMLSQEPQHGLPISQPSIFAKGDPDAHCFLQGPAAQEVAGFHGPLRYEDQAAWSHYVKYLMCSQEPWNQPSLPEQQSQDPQWQAAMMAMMIDPS